MKSKSYKINLSQDMLTAMVKGVLKHEHASIIADVLVNHLDDYGVEQLHNAFHGIAPSVPFHHGQECLVAVGRLCGYRYSAADQDDLIVQGKYMMATIIEVDPYKRDCVKVEYTIRDSSGDLVTESTRLYSDDLIIERYD
jgi:hypothetical protein